MTGASNRRILVIDDLPSIHVDFRKILLAGGGAAAGATANLSEFESALFGIDAAKDEQPLEVDSAFQGAEGLDRVREALAEGRPYALAFVDMRMPPGWNGVETIARLWEADPRLQVVLCTAYSDIAWEDLLDRVDARDRLLILKKPFDPVEVSQLAAALTAKWQLALETSRQIVELTKAANDRAAWNERLLRTNRLEAVGTLAAGVAHEFNTILGVIHGYAELLADASCNGAEEKSQLHEIVSAVDRARTMIGRVLEFARQDDGAPTRIDAVAAIRESVSLLRPSLPSRIALAFESTLDSAWLNADPAQLHQIIANLIGNSADAIPDVGRIVVCLDREPDSPCDTCPSRGGWATSPCVRLSVTDTGSGIERADLPRIFDPFFTTKPPGRGCGLGLSIVHGLATALGGQVGVTSTPGEGTRFDISLPAATTINGVQPCSAGAGRAGHAGRSDQSDHESHVTSQMDTPRQVEKAAAP